MAKSRDIWDVLAALNALANPDITTPLANLDDYVSVSDPVALTDSVTHVNPGHSGTYSYGNAASIWGAAQWS